MTYETIDVQPIAGALGAEILGIDLSREMDNRTFDELHRAYAAFGVIFFRDQDLTPEQHIAFARRWGKIDVNRYFPHVDGYPEIAEVTKKPGEKVNIGGRWHTDHTYDKAPAMGSILYAREMPDYGGDTMFASMYAAFEALSPGMQRLTESLTAVHSAADVFGPQASYGGNQFTSKFSQSETADAEVEHPVVITHPLSGRKALFVNRSFTKRFKDMTEAESAPLLEQLYTHAAQPEFTCRFRWRVGSIAFWDNRATHHFAVNDYTGGNRRMHRITVAGVPLS